jgi:hypothetical protein
MAEHVFHNTKVIDKTNHWSLLLYQESLAIQRNKPELNHELNVARELPGGKRIRIINMRAQHITFNKAIKTVLKDCKEF